MTINKKKYDVSWSIFNLGKANTGVVVQLQNFSDAIFGSLATYSYFMTNPNYALLIGLGTLVLNKMIGCLEVEEIKQIGVE